jgi:hypothetical protein
VKHVAPPILWALPVEVEAAVEGDVEGSRRACRGFCRRVRRRCRVLQETMETEEIIERVAALDIGKAELMCCGLLDELLVVLCPGEHLASSRDGRPLPAGAMGTAGEI